MPRARPWKPRQRKSRNGPPRCTHGEARRARGAAALSPLRLSHPYAAVLPTRVTPRAADAGVRRRAERVHSSDGVGARRREVVVRALPARQARLVQKSLCSKRPSKASGSALTSARPWAALESRPLNPADQLQNLASAQATSLFPSGTRITVGTHVTFSIHRAHFQTDPHCPTRPAGATRKLHRTVFAKDLKNAKRPTTLRVKSIRKAAETEPANKYKGG